MPRGKFQVPNERPGALFGEALAEDHRADFARFVPEGLVLEAVP